MQRNFLEIFDQPDDFARVRSEQLGYACTLMSQSASHSKRSMLYLRRVIEPAVMHRHIKFYFNCHGAPVAYVAWAFLAPEAEQRIRATGKWQLHISEWTEGESLWIVDLLAPNGNIKHVLADLRDRIFADQQSVRYCNVRKGSHFVVEHTRTCSNSFLRPRT